MDSTDRLAEFQHQWLINPVQGVRDLFGAEPTAQQIEIIKAAWDPTARLAVSSCTGAGKFLCNYEKIHTPNGLTEIGAFTIGDRVSNSYGGFSNVTGVYPQGKQHIYRVHFNNGTHVDSGLEHLWIVSSYHSHTNFTTLSLEEILERGIFVDTIKSDRNPSGRRLKYYLPPIEPIYKEYQKVPIDPYTMGVWLGDGTRCSGTITNIDKEVWDNIAYAKGLGGRQTATALGLITDLKKTTVWQEGSHSKFVPREYMDNCFEVRLDVISGLMDTDGTIDKSGRLTYYTTSERLRDDFIYLIRSVGGTTKGYSTKKTTHSDCYCIQFQFNRPERLFKIERKEARRCHKVNSSRVYISSVEYIGEHEATCISVDSVDKLYICENFIPTHNTTVLSWLTYLFLLTQDDCRILVTSPSFGQLTRVYYAEMIKWKGRMPDAIAALFRVTREKVTLTTGKRIQVANLVTASADNKESLQGGHADAYVVLADEASGIEEATFDVLLGTLSTGGRLIMTSNPTRSSGRFHEVFHKDLRDWKKLFLSAFDCPHISKEWISQIEEMYGSDSDQYRIRVQGIFPRATDTQFISSESIDEAINNELSHNAYSNFPIVIGADIARFGDDQTVFVVRQGPKILNINQIKGADTMAVAEALFEYQAQFKAQVIYIDSIGVGAGVFDRAKQLQLPVKEVIGSHKSTKPMEYTNFRSQLWGDMRGWLNNGADLPNMPELRSQLASMTYGYNAKMQTALATKKDMKRQGLKSPDLADAISLTFAGAVYGSASAMHKPRRIRKSNHYYV